MKKYLSHILVSAFLLTILVGVGGSVFPHTIQAQTAPDCSASNPLAYLNPLCGPLTSTGRSQATSAAAGEAAVWVISTVVAPISLLILRITSLLTILSGGILNFVVNQTIVEMAKNYKEISAISGAWGTVRDVANMGFIFILLYASIEMILGIGKDVRKLIVNIIIAALLINFSMFFTQVVIDAANIIALTFYHAIAPAAATGDIFNAGLSNSLMAPLNLTTIWDNIAKLDSDKLAIIGIMGSVITLVAAFIFFSIAVMLVIRYVVLILVLILSPIAFIGDVIPGASGYAGQWRKALFGQAFFAPVYMFLTWVTIKIFTGPAFPTNEGSTWAKAFTGEVGGVTSANQAVAASSDSISLIFNFVVAIVFLIATLVLSKKVSESAGLGINNLTKKAMGFASGTLVGGTLRNTIGRMGGAVADNANLQNAAKTKTGLAGAASRLALYASKKARSGTFDIQNAAVPTGVFSDAIRGTVGRTETGKKLGLDKFDAIPSVNISDLTGEARGGDKGYRETQLDKNKKFQKIREDESSEAQRAIDKATILAGLEVGVLAGSPEYIAMEKAINRMSDKEIEAIVSSNRSLLEEQKFATTISTQQLEALNKSSELSDAEKSTLKNNRFQGINTALAPGGVGTPAISSEIKALSDKELEMIDPGHLNNAGFIAQLRPAQMEAIQKSSKFTSSQKTSIKNLRRAPLLEALDLANPNYAANPAVVGSTLGKMPAKDLAALMGQNITYADPLTGVNTVASILTHPDVLPLLKPNKLQQMALEMSDSDIQTLRTALLAGGSTATVAWLNNPMTGGSIFS